MLEAIYFTMLVCAAVWLLDKVIIWMMDRVDNSKTGYLRIRPATRSYPLTRKERVSFRTRVVFMPNWHA